MYSSKIKEEVQRMRLDGLSAEELSRIFSIPRGTAYHWTKDIILSPEARRKLQVSSEKGKKLGRDKNAERRLKENELIKNRVIKDLHNVKPTSVERKILCSFLFWAEGAKVQNCLKFINSDPVMVKMFLKLLRESFSIDEKKFRLIVHIHEYHNEEEILSFWSSSTQIPREQFNRSYLKPHTGKNNKENYKGCLSITYYDARIAKELSWLYTTFCQSYLGL